MNKKGVIIPVVLAFQIAFGIVGALCVVNVPAWTKAKHDRAVAQEKMGNGGYIIKN